MGTTKYGHVPILHQIALHWAQKRSMKQTGITKQQSQQEKMAMQAATDQWSAYLQASAAVMQSSLDRVLTSDVPECSNLTELHAAVNHCFHSFFPPMSATQTKTPWKQTTGLVLNNWQHRSLMLNISNLHWIRCLSSVVSPDTLCSPQT
jgi:hypothetical protein